MKKVNINISIEKGTTKIKLNLNYNDPSFNETRIVNYDSLSSAIEDCKFFFDQCMVYLRNYWFDKGVQPRIDLKA